MWECYNCAFLNVDTSPVCSRCRARKPLHGEKMQRRSYHSQETLSRERAAHELMDQMIPNPPTVAEIVAKWKEAALNQEELLYELATLENRQFAIREALRLMIQVVKNPQAKGQTEVLQNAVQVLINWDGQVE